MPKISFLASLEVADKFMWGGVVVVVQLITLSTPTRVEVELGCGWAVPIYFTVRIYDNATAYHLTELLYNFFSVCKYDGSTV
jgi:hypothetical protein